MALRLALAAALLAACGAQSTCPVVPLAYPDGAPVLSPVLLDSSSGAVVDLQFLGADSGFALALTSGGHLWRSVNGGLTWSDDTPRLMGAAGNQGVAAIVVSASHPSRVLLVGHYNHSLATTLLWTTTTSGYTYEQPCALGGGGESCASAPAEEIVFVKPHPTAPNVLALMSRRRVCNGQSSDCVRQDVWVTTNFAHTWQSSLQRAGSSVAGFIDADWHVARARLQRSATCAAHTRAQGARDAGAAGRGRPAFGRAARNCVLERRRPDARRVLERLLG